MSIGSLPYPKAFSLSLSSAHKQERTYLHFRCLIRMSGRKFQNNNNNHIYFAYLQTSSSCSNRDFNINQFTLSYLCRRYIANHENLSFQSESSINHVKSSRNSAKTNRSLKCAHFFFTHWNYFGKIIFLYRQHSHLILAVVATNTHTHTHSLTQTLFAFTLISRIELELAISQCIAIHAHFMPIKYYKCVIQKHTTK